MKMRKLNAFIIFFIFPQKNVLAKENLLDILEVRVYITKLETYQMVNNKIREFYFIAYRIRLK